MKINQIYLIPMTMNLSVGQTDGRATLTGCGLFSGGVHGAILPVGLGEPTQPARASLQKLIRDATFAQFFGSLGESRARWEEGQVVEVCGENLEMLRISGFDTYFELKRGFVVRVVTGPRQLVTAYVFPFLYADKREIKLQSRVVTLQ